MKNFRSAFTLLELLVTMGIMSMLGIAATGGYHALVRGMTERGVTAAGSAVLRAARERAAIDRSNVAVFCYNRLLRAPNVQADEPGVAVGVITAVRRVGRLSGVSGNFLYDEFADLEQTYETEDSAADLGKRKGMRLYKFTNAEMSRMEYSIVADATYLDENSNVYLPSEDKSTNSWMGAFYNLKQSDYEPSQWKAGDAYGMAFLEVQLPEGYIFGQSIPSEVGRIEIYDKPIIFNPRVESVKTADIWLSKPDASGQPKAWKKIGIAKSDDSGV